MHKGKFQSSDQKSVSINCPTESDYICTIRPKLITNVIACRLNEEVWNPKETTVIDKSSTSCNMLPKCRQFEKYYRL